MELREIARLCAASQMLDREIAAAEPSGFVIDSRAITPGDLFVALPGEHVDGHRFVREVFEKGALAALVVHHRLPFASDLGALAGRLLFVDDTLSAFQRLAQRVIAAWRRPVIGVTGSAGKTTMKDIIAHCLQGGGNTLKSLGNLNTGYGLPLTISRMIAGGAKPEDFDFVVLEMGMSSFGEIARLTDLAAPRVGVVGNVGTAHLEFFGSRERIARAKAEMVDGVEPGGTAVLNADDPLVLGMRDRRDDLQIVTFGVDSEADVRAERIEEPEDLSRTSFLLRTPRGESMTSVSLIGRHNVYNALAGAAVGHILGLDPDQIASRLATVGPSRMRGELIRFSNGVTVIDDSYNSNPQALMQAVRAMPVPQHDAHRDRTGFLRRIVVAGEMLELGSMAETLHRQCGREIAEAKIDRLIGVRGLAKEMVRSAGDSIEALYFDTPEEAVEFLIADSKPGDLILVKGSRGVRTERAIEKLRAAFGAPDVS
jgi:UDP-N-acetylmuramoyl-tripeptide--D-alanyl-D-alanine ligase